jgi:hypothetical protein
MFKRFRQLIVKRWEGTLEGSEQEELEGLIQAFPELRQLDRELSDEEIAWGVDALLELDAMDLAEEAAEDGLGEMIVLPAPRRLFTMRRLIGAAAVLITGCWVYLTSCNSVPLPKSFGNFDATVQLMKIRALPGRSCIVLSRSDTVWLDRIPLMQGVVCRGWRVYRDDSNSIQLMSVAVPGGDPSVGACPIIFTTYREIWKFSWQDGSRIALAPGSTLAFHMRKEDLSGGRELALRGEAWWEMSGNAHSPVWLSTMKGGVTVLGTSFDVRDYSEEEYFYVSLAKGTVRVNNGSRIRILKPGQEGRIHQSIKGIEVVDPADAPDRSVWLDSVFVFSHQNVKQVMAQVIQWYGLKGAVYDQSVDTVRRGILGGGEVKKDLPLNELQDKFKEWGVKSYVEDNVIYVSQ